MQKTARKKKETTIDDLATMMVAGFKDVNKKIAKGAEDTNALVIMVAKGFASVDKRFDEVDKRFEAVDKRFDRLENTVFKIDSKLESVDKRLKKVEEAIEPLLMGYSITRKESQELNSRVFRLEKKAGVVK